MSTTQVFQDVLGWIMMPNHGLPLAFIGLIGCGFLLPLIYHKLSSLIPAAKGSENSDLSNIPFPAWILEDGTVVASNDLFNNSGLHADATGRSFAAIDAKNSAYDIYSATNETISHNYAIPADHLVALEQTNKRLLETLSVTFAKLPIGLAIFDADRCLTHFNPAISQILSLHPVWLAKRPSLRAVLEKLREIRHLPEQKDFLQWRRLLTDMQLSKDGQSYEEIWPIADGRKIKVVGEAHANGAVTFLFEDVTQQVELEQKHYAETALNQAIIDTLSTPLSLFDASGRLLLTNRAFDDLLPTAPGRAPADFTLTHLNTAFPDAAPIWERLRNTISVVERRESWTARIAIGPWRSFVATPMPDGTTMISFRSAQSLQVSEPPLSQPTITAITG